MLIGDNCETFSGNAQDLNTRTGFQKRGRTENTNYFYFLTY